jgi:ribosomal protein S10
MHVFNISIQSKHKTYLTRFIKLFNSKSKTHFKSVKQYLQKKRNTSFFSILTSPHINKRAQEQFKTHRLKLQLKIQTLEPLKLIILLKRVYSQSLPNLRIKIKITVNKKISKHRITYSCPLKVIVKKHAFHKTKVLKILDGLGV